MTIHTAVQNSSMETVRHTAAMNSSLQRTERDYDWDHAYNVETGEQIPLYPEDGDEEGAALKTLVTEDNMCYTIEDTEGNTVTDPQGILYMTANSAAVPNITN